MTSLLNLAWRSLWRHKRRTLITVSSIGFGLAFSLFFISLGHGTYAQLIHDAVRVQAGHVTVENAGYRDAPSIDLYLRDAQALREKAAKIPQVSATKLLILAQGVAKSGNGSVGIALAGIDPQVERAISPLARNIVQGAFLEENDGAVVLVGVKLAEHLKIQVGKKLVITTNDVNGNLVEELCRVKGIFKTGSDEMDGYFVQTPLQFARRLYGMPDGSATQLGLLLDNPDDQQKVLREMQALMSPDQGVVLPWEKVIPEVAAWIRLDRSSNYIFQCVLLCTVLFTIFNTLLMSVMERQKEFAVQLALGTPIRRLKIQIFFESAFVGAMGSLFGVTLGGLIGLYVQIHGIDLTRFYKQGMSISSFALSSTVHSEVTFTLLATVGSIVFVATLLVSLIPMQKTGGIAITENLR